MILQSLLRRRPLDRVRLQQLLDELFRYTRTKNKMQRKKINPSVSAQHTPKKKGIAPS
jgi:hypothetical protein